MRTKPPTCGGTAPEGGGGGTGMNKISEHTTNRESRIPACTFPVGDYIREELEARGWTDEDLAERSGLDMSQVIGVQNGRGITLSIAKGLAKAFDTSHELWLGLAGVHPTAEGGSEGGIAVSDEALDALIQRAQSWARHFAPAVEDDNNWYRGYCEIDGKDAAEIGETFTEMARLLPIIRRQVIEELAREADQEENRYYHERKPGMQDSFAILAKWLRSHE